MRSDLAPWRLGPQLLVGSTLDTPAEVVRHFGAVQSQEHLWAPWAVGLRCGATFEQVLDGLWPAGVVRTHALRTTWHYVHTDDLPHVIAATADRVMGQLVPHVRRAGLAEDRLLAASEVVTQVVRENPGCTRTLIAERLAEAGYEEKGDRLAHVVMAAELRGDIGGERRPGQHEYHPLELGPLPSTDDALAWIARTYARGHGPVTAHDLAWWSSLTVRQARRAIELAELRPVTLAGQELWSLGEPEAVEVPPVLLLANFDEVISHVRDAAVKADAGHGYDAAMFATGLLFLHGRLQGHWRRSVKGDEVDVEVSADRPLTRSEQRHLDAQVERYRAFSS
ncbi:winged helix DNA-binding domain-containing protein [Aeromicrobium sp. Leaf350]|uniref:winged helix DNA-binding domain-containing protein n=1 Tax=Aeromicrobium sp. Leaf350 TaxID=2876565 RepID=UPI001E31F4FC|nr:winged helix DNA-binding domain-containing protein [Aeromicrobium sp. Leaf350]